MLKNCLIVVLLNIRRERTNAQINIVGLTVGLAICLLVMAYVADEMSYDSFHSAQAFRVNHKRPIENDSARIAGGKC